MLYSDGMIAGTFLVGAGTVYGCSGLWCRLDKGDGIRGIHRAILLKGGLVPILFWMLLNSAWIPGVPALVEVTPSPGTVVPDFTDWLAAVSGGVSCIITCCGAVLLLWWLGVAYVRMEDKRAYRRILLFWSILCFIPAVWVVRALGPGSMGAGLMALFMPAAWSLLPFIEVPEIKPMYAKAVAKRMFGKFEDSEREILSELEKKPDDYEGWMMLAELLAVQYKNMEEAELTILELTGQPGLSRWQINHAWYSLAEWYLKVESDPVKAKSAFERIIQSMPDSHFARMAGIRIKNLPTVDEIHRIKTPVKIALQPSQFKLGLQKQVRGLEDIEGDYDQVALDCETVLKGEPFHLESLEKWIVIRALHHEKTADAARRLTEILKKRRQPILVIDRWLRLVEAFPLRAQADLESVSEFYARVLEAYPHSSFSEMLRSEIERLQSSRVVDLQVRGGIKTS